MNALKILTNQKHFTKTKCFTKLTTVIVAREFSLGSFKLKRGILYLPEQNECCYLKTTCHIKPKLP